MNVKLYKIISITYEPFTQMTKNITVTGSPTKTMSFIYSADNERILKNETQGTTNNNYVYIRGSNEYPITEKANLNSSLTDRIYIYGPTGLIAFKDATATYFVIKDHLGSTRVLFSSTGSQYTTYDYSPFGSLMRATINGEVVYQFTGQEFDSETALYNFRARLYDDEIGIFYAVDPAGQNFSPFSYTGNNPVVYIDKDGRFWWLPIIIGAVIGGYSGYEIGKANNATGWDMFGYIAGGALIGGAAGGSAVGVSALGGSGFWAGASAGAISGAGFNGLATNWHGGSMLAGFLKGGISGGIGGTFGEAIGGGWGAFAGGGIGSGLNTAFSGGNWGQIGVSAIAGGAFATAMYHTTSFINWKFGGGDIGGITYDQFTTMQADYQRSRFWEKEYGGWLLNDGSVERWPVGTSSDVTSTPMPSNAWGEYHIHWDEPGQIRYYLPSAGGNYIDNPNAYPSGSVKQFTTVQYHGPMDFPSTLPSFVINRYDASVYIPGFGPSYSIINYPVTRFIYSFFFWR